jgi:DNA-binding transcriptional ArsR family regulator
MDPLDVLVHPIRLRIVHAMSGQREMTTSNLCLHLPDVPKSSVYRHVALLADAGVLEVVGEQRVHGAVERRFRLHQARAVIDQQTAASMTIDEHRRLFAATIAALVAEFNAYLDSKGADPTADSVSYRRFPLWLTQTELATLSDEVGTSIRSRLPNTPASDRKPYLLSTILFPTDYSPARALPAGEAGEAMPRR